MFASLPEYRRIAEAVIPRLRKDPHRTISNRFAGKLLSLALLAGLWGLPLYARWMVLSDRNPPLPLSEAVLGEWRSDDRNILAFNRLNQKLWLSQDGVIIESANYRIQGEELEVSGFIRQPDNLLLPVGPQRYQISIRVDRLIVRLADTGFTNVPCRADEGSKLRRVLPPWHGTTLQFQRVDIH
jgi:hypothetical protein